MKKKDKAVILFQLGPLKHASRFDRDQLVLCGVPEWRLGNRLPNRYPDSSQRCNPCSSESFSARVYLLLPVIIAEAEVGVPVTPIDDPVLQRQLSREPPTPMKLYLHW